MGFFNRLRAELVDVIEWRNEEPAVLVSRFGRYGHEIKMNAKLIVRPGQRAIFVNEGQVADTFGPGTYKLETNNLPILSSLKGWKYGYYSPFKAEVFFLKTSDQVDRKWVTPIPIMLRDQDFGIVRLKARGNYTYHLATDSELISRFVGSNREWSNRGIEGDIKTKLISCFTDLMGKLKIPALDLQLNYDEINAEMTQKLQKVFNQLGLKLVSFTVENITLPEAVEKAMDQHSIMEILGNLNRFTKYQAANAFEGVAKQEGGGGPMMGMMMGAKMADNMGEFLSQEESKSIDSGVPCTHGKVMIKGNSEFCLNSGELVSTTEMVACIACNKLIVNGANFCPECGFPQIYKCSNCQTEITPSSKFCQECGSKQ